MLSRVSLCLPPPTDTGLYLGYLSHSPQDRGGLSVRYASCSHTGGLSLVLDITELTLFGRQSVVFPAVDTVLLVENPHLRH